MMGPEKGEHPASILTSSIPLSLVEIASVHVNVKQDVIVTTEDKLRLCLTDHLCTLEEKRGWIAPLGIFLTVVATLITAKFQSVGLTADVWEAVFVIVAVLTFVWLLLAIRKALHAKTLDDLVVAVKSASGTIATKHEAPRETSDLGHEGKLVLEDALDTSTKGIMDGGTHDICEGRPCYLLTSESARVLYDRRLPREGVLEFCLFVPASYRRDGLVICDANDEFPSEDFSVVVKPNRAITFNLKQDGPGSSSDASWLEEDVPISEPGVSGWHTVRVMWGRHGVKTFLDGQMVAERADQAKPLHHVSRRFGVGKVATGAYRNAAVGVGVRDLVVKAL